MGKYDGWSDLSEADVKRLGATRNRNGVLVSEAKAKPSKYHAEPTTVDGIRFASKKEAKRYGELKVLEQAGEITGLRIQPRFPLWAHTFVADDDPGRVGEYRADFAYETKDGALVVEDVKGFKTQLYIWKKKHMAAQYNIVVVEV